MEDALSHPRRARVRLVRAPLAPVALAMMGGIVAGRFGPLSGGVWVVWGGGALAAAVGLLVTRRRALAAGAMAAAILAFAAAHAHTAYFRLPADHVVTRAGPSQTLASLRGRIASSPLIGRSDDSMDYPHEPTTSFVLAAEQINTATGWQPTCGRVQVSVLQEAPLARRGQFVELVGKITRYHRASNPGQRDVAAEARRAGRMVRFQVPGADGITLLADARPPGWFIQLRERASAAAAEHLARCAPGRGGTLVEALILGRRDPSLRDLNDTMARAGIAHLLSISGMHLGIFLGFVYLLCRLATLGPSRSAAVALLCLLGYLVLAEPRSPLLRSAVMAAAVCAGAIVHRRNMALNSLALAAVVLLIYDPMDLFAPGFQLSFAIVAGLIVLTRPLRELMFGRWVRRRGLMVFRDDQRVRRWLHHTAADWGMMAAVVSPLAWLVSAPLVAYHFGLLSPLGAPLTLLVLPMVVAVIVPGYASLGLAPLAGNLAYGLGWLSARAAEAMATAIEAIARLPGLCLEMQPVGAAWVLAAYAAIVTFILQRRLLGGRMWVVATAGLALALTAQTQRSAPAPGVAELNVLAVGAGQCAVLTAPDGRTCVLDAGSLGRADCGREILVPFLRHQRLAAPAAAFISHANSDHYNGVPVLLGRGWLRQVYLNDYFGREQPGPDPPVIELIDLWRRDGIQPDRLRPGRTVRLDERTTVEVLWPPPGRTGLTPNDGSLVLRVVCDGLSALLPGDLTAVGQAELVAKGANLRCDVLVMPHHGSWSRALPAFVEAAAPKVVLVSGARDPAEGSRTDVQAAAFYRRLKADHRYYCTVTHGWIQVRFGKGKVQVKTMRE